MGEASDKLPFGRVARRAALHLVTEMASVPCLRPRMAHLIS